MRHGPWWLADLQRQMDELSGALGGPYRSWVIPVRTGRWVPACDVVSRDGDLVVRLDLPGIDPDKDVQVTLQDGTLRITGERREPGGGDGGYHRREWHYGPFERGFTLPEGAAGEGITASYRDGVVEVVVPKAAQRAEPRQIPVSTGDETAGHPGQRVGGPVGNLGRRSLAGREPGLPMRPRT